MTSRFALLAPLFLAVVVLAVGLAAGVWQTPSALYAGLSGTLARPSIALPTVVLAGLADGINPCAFTLLLLFVATLFPLYRDAGPAGIAVLRRTIAVRGGAYILAIFLTYLVLGTGLMRLSTALAQNHLGARLGALASIALGLWMLKDYFVPDWGWRLAAPSVVGRWVRNWAAGASALSMFALGALVSLCTVPCSGAVYLAVVSLLALQEDFVLAYGYLVLYNVTFVVPLVAILAATSSRPVIARAAHWNLHNRERMRLVLGGSAVVLGLAILATA